VSIELSLYALHAVLSLIMVATLKKPNCYKYVDYFNQIAMTIFIIANLINGSVIFWNADMQKVLYVYSLRSYEIIGIVKWTIEY
jgi:hypothetical protein